MHFYIPHWVFVVFAVGAISIPFVLYNIFQNGALHSGAAAPFTHYQGITSGANAVVAGMYFVFAQYRVFGWSLVGLGLCMVAVINVDLFNWYRKNPDYVWRRVVPDRTKARIDI